jgi:hypothetical protein
MKAKSFHMKRRSTACAAKPARKISALVKAIDHGLPTDVLGSFDRLLNKKARWPCQRAFCF